MKKRIGANKERRKEILKQIKKAFKNNDVISFEVVHGTKDVPTNFNFRSEPTGERIIIFKLSPFQL